MYDAHGRKIPMAADDLVSIASGVSAVKLQDDDDFAPKVALPSVDEVSVRPVWDQPKNPVSHLNEYCQRRDFTLTFEVTDKPLALG